MSVRVMSAAWATDLPAGDKLVLLALADCANDEGRCWPGLATLCEKTGRCKRSLQESLRSLDAAGHLTRVENPGKGMNYTVHPVAKSATRANSATGAKSATPGSKKCHPPVAKSAPKPSKNHQESSRSSEPNGSSPRPWALPVGVSLQVWTDFLANRKRKRLSNTPTAWKAFNDDLTRVSSQTGIPPPQLIEQCTAKGWGAIYDPRDHRNERSQQQPSGIGRTEAAALAALRH